MLLAVDIGNSNVSLALFDSGSDSPIAFSKISALKNRSDDEYAVLIKNILDMKLAADYSVDSVAISSVVPSLTGTVVRAVEALTGIKTYIIAPGIKTGFKISINDPACLGSDIVSNTAAALDVLTPPFIIFDAGTANTITYVDESCSVVGTVIMPGLGVSSSALNNTAELIDPITITTDHIPLIGKTTTDSVLSGLINGNSIMIDGFVRNIRESVIPKGSGIKLGLIATGGFAKLITGNCRNKFIVDDHLTLKGIASLYYRNVGK